MISISRPISKRGNMFPSDPFLLTRKSLDVELWPCFGVNRGHRRCATVFTSSASLYSFFERIYTSMQLLYNIHGTLVLHCSASVVLMFLELNHLHCSYSSVTLIHMACRAS